MREWFSIVMGRDTRINPEVVPIVAGAQEVTMPGAGVD